MNVILKQETTSRKISRKVFYNLVRYYQID